MSISFGSALKVLNEIKATGVVQEYAIGGAMALVFWTEPIATYDLDVFVLFPPQEGPILSLAPLYEWARGRGYTLESEHIMIEGVPVQFLPSHNALSDEAIETARTMDYDGVAVRVVRPEYLAALYLEPSARTPKRRERVAALKEAGETDQALLKQILQRYNLEE